MHCIFVFKTCQSGVDANNQIDVFITEHGGPGVQHIGLNTSDICRSKRFMQQKGVSFIEPPPTYYKEGGKLRDIIKAGESECGHVSPLLGCLKYQMLL